MHLNEMFQLCKYWREVFKKSADPELVQNSRQQRVALLGLIMCLLTGHGTPGAS